jgi:NAD(P)-dependent dehydrogenase (short-subunit alcohol dehydrogenase family)
MNEGRPGTAQRVPDNVAGRTVLPGDVAKTVAYLLSDDAELLSGTVVNVGSFAGQGGMARGTIAR